MAKFSEEVSNLNLGIDQKQRDQDALDQENKQGRRELGAYLLEAVKYN